MVDLDVDRRPGAPARRRPDEEFDAFYEATSPSLLGQLYAFCGDLAEAEDCLQEAYVRTWQRWRRVSRYDNPAGFVRTVAWRLAVSRWHRARTGTLAWARHGPAPAVPGPSADAVALTAALRRIPADQRRAIVLHHLAGMTVEEIADQEHLPSGTVKTRLSRGRACLARVLGEEER